MGECFITRRGGNVVVGITEPFVAETRSIVVPDLVGKRHWLLYPIDTRPIGMTKDKYFALYNIEFNNGTYKAQYIIENEQGNKVLDITGCVTLSKEGVLSLGSYKVYDHWDATEYNYTLAFTANQFCYIAW